jgi:hypothetical protein
MNRSLSAANPRPAGAASGFIYDVEKTAEAYPFVISLFGVCVAGVRPYCVQAVFGQLRSIQLCHHGSSVVTAVLSLSFHSRLSLV